MKPKNQGGAPNYTTVKLIADLKRAVEALVSGKMKPYELEGLRAEATALAAQWKITDPTGRRRPLFDHTANLTPLLLAALVVIFKRDHELVQLMRRHRPGELEKLISESSHDDAVAIASAWAKAQPQPTAKQQSERKRRKWHRSVVNSIEYQFGGDLEANLRKRILLLVMSNHQAYEKILFESQSCLDGLLAGRTVNMLTLEELFWMDRHRFAGALRGFQKRRFNYLAVTKIMHFLLKEKPRTKRKRATRGRPERVPWLSDPRLRVRVLREIEARINSLSVGTDIGSAFLTVIRRHLPKSGKK